MSSLTNDKTLLSFVYISLQILTVVIFAYWIPNLNYSVNGQFVTIVYVSIYGGSVIFVFTGAFIASTLLPELEVSETLKQINDKVTKLKIAYNGLRKKTWAHDNDLLDSKLRVKGFKKENVHLFVDYIFRIIYDILAQYKNKVHFSIDQIGKFKLRKDGRLLAPQVVFMYVIFNSVYKIVQPTKRLFSNVLFVVAIYLTSFQTKLILIFDISNPLNISVTQCVRLRVYIMFSLEFVG